MNRVFRIGAAFVGAFAAGITGLFFIGSGTGAWYASLAKPPLAAPEWLLVILLIALYIMMALACSIVWTREKQNTHTESWVRFYFVHLLPNTGWLIFFF